MMIINSRLFRSVARPFAVLLLVIAAILLAPRAFLPSGSAEDGRNDRASRARQESASSDRGPISSRTEKLTRAVTPNASPGQSQSFGLLGSSGDVWKHSWSRSSSDSTVAGKQSQDGIWQEIPESFIVSGQERLVLANAYRTYQLNVEAFSKLIAHVPMEFSGAAKTAAVVMTLPMPDGSFQRFRVVDSPISASASSDFKSFTGQGIDDPTAIAKIDWSQYGFHAMVLSSGDAVFVDPYATSDITHYPVHYRRDTQRGAALLCLSLDQSRALEKGLREDLRTGTLENLENGTALTTLRTAVALTSGYTNFFKQTGDSDAQQKDRALAALKTTMIRVNGIWER